mgnify:CR=1 FL=1
MTGVQTCALPIYDEIDAAIAFASESPLPKPEDVVKDVYTDIVEEVCHS